MIKNQAETAGSRSRVFYCKIQIKHPRCVPVHIWLTNGDSPPYIHSRGSGLFHLGGRPSSKAYFIFLIEAFLWYIKAFSFTSLSDITCRSWWHLLLLHHSLNHQYVRTMFSSSMTYDHNITSKKVSMSLKLKVPVKPSLSVRPVQHSVLWRWQLNLSQLVQLSCAALNNPFSMRLSYK